jgi:hypothetical protein
MSHNLVTEIKKMLTHGEIGTQIAFPRGMTSKTPYYLFIPSLMQEPTPSLLSNPMLIWWIAGEAICREEGV